MTDDLAGTFDRPWHARILTLYPEMFPGPLAHAIAGTALNEGKWRLDTVNIRDFGIGPHKSVDDTPAGGGAGMVMRCDVVCAAVDHARTGREDLPLIYLTPRGTPLTQAMAENLAAGPGALLVAGRFEGIDQRAIEARNMLEVSVGDYVLSGGELPAMILIDACVRLLPGVIGTAASLNEESFSAGTLEYPQYTRPRQWEDRQIPDVLLSGNHKKIADWRRQQSEALTRKRRPDLLK